MSKRLLSALSASALSVTAALAAFPAGSLVLTAKADDPVTGETSDGFTYEIGEDYVEITGWTGDKETVTSLIMPDTIDGQTVTNISVGALTDMPLLTELRLPSDLQEFRWFNLSNCGSLKELTIPKTIKQSGGIEAGTAYGAGFHTALSDSAIETIILEDGIEYVPSNLCNGLGTVTKVVIPDSVKTIGQSAFANADSLAELDIPSSVTVIEPYAFEYNDAITEMILPEGIETISYSVFKDCDSLTTVKLPSTLRSIGNSAFESCDVLSSVEFNEGLESIGMYIFTNVPNVKEVTVPSTVTDADYMFENSSVETVNVAYGMERLPDSLCAASGVTTLNMPDTVTDMGSNTFSRNEGIKEYTVPAHITAGRDTFNTSALETVSFEGDRTEIPESMFRVASNLKTINFPANITKIGEYAFYQCTSLEEVYIPDTVKEIGNHAFGYCGSLTDLHLPENGFTLGDYAFYSNTALKSVYIPAGIEYTSTDNQYTFYCCYSLESVTFAEGNTIIPASGFRDCTSLHEVNIPGTMDEIQYRAFSGCSSLRSIEINDSVTKINREAFSSCTALSSVKLPENLTYLGSYVFEYCQQLESITIPKNINESGGSAFYRSGLTDVWFEEGIETIPYDMCNSSTNLTTAHIPGSVKMISNQAFYDCPRLETLDMPFEPGELIPNENYENSTFYGCDSLIDERVNVADKASTFINRIETASGENGLINYTIYYDTNSAFKDMLESGYIHVESKSGNPIASRSLIVGLRPSETSTYSVNFPFDADEQAGVFHFTTEPEPDADTTIRAYISVRYNNSYREFSDNVMVDNGKTSAMALSLTAPEFGNLRDGSATVYLYGDAPVDSEVTIYVNGEAAAAVTSSKYTGRYSYELSCSGSNGDTITVYAECGELKTAEKTIRLATNRTDVEKLLLTHDNNHTAYTIDITEAYKFGATPYIAYNPSKPLAFEATLSDNNCEAVFISSTVNDVSSAIELFFDEETGTWKGEGFFKTSVPGTLNVLAFKSDSQYMLEYDSTANNGRGSLKLGNTDFLADTPDDQIDLARDFVKEADFSLIAEDENGAMLRYQYTLDGLEGDTGLYSGRSETVVMNGVAVTADEVAEAPEKYGFEKSPAQVRDENGNIHTYYVKFMVGTDDLIELADNTFIEAEEEPVQSAPGGVLKTAKKRKSVSQWAYENQDINASIVSGSIVVDKVQEAATGGSKSDYVTTVVTEAGKTGIGNYLDAKGMSGLNNGVGTAMTVAEVGVRTVGWWGEMKAINESKNPRVQEEKYFFMGCSSCIFATRVASIVVGGAIVAGTVGGVIAGTLASAPCLIASAVVVGTVVGVNMLIDKVHNWFKPIFAGEAVMTDGFKLKYLIDPSGIAYEFLPSNPIEGVTAEIYYKDESGNEVLWNAVDYDQLNPQITDRAGWFAWDVPEGEWKIKLTAEGYESTESEWLPVLPVQTDVNLDMRSKLPAEIASAEYNSTSATITFTRHMKDESINTDSLYITDKDGNTIPAAIKTIKESGNDTDSSITFVLTPKDKTDLEGASVNLTADAVTYAGTASNPVVQPLVKGEESDIPGYILLGDVTGDGLVDATDASSILQEYAALSTGNPSGYTELQRKAGDVNFDDMIDASDASNILQYYAYLSTGGTGTLEEYFGS